MIGSLTKEGKMSKKIISIDFVKKMDESPDLSYLGEYSNNPTEHCIDRKENGDQCNGEYRFFNFGCGSSEYLQQDYERAEKFNCGEWWMLSCYAEAEIVVNGDVQIIRSGGLSGVESDSDESYFKEIRDEEFQQLTVILLDLGFSKGEIKRKVKVYQMIST
jgi:hypothetical protein